MTVTHDGLAVEWLGYATVRVESSDRVVYVDPGRYGVLTGEWTPPGESAAGAHPPAGDYRPEDGDVVLVTHVHHYDPDGIERVARPDATVLAFEGIDVRGTDRTDVRPGDLPFEVRRVGTASEGTAAGVPFWTVAANNRPDGPHTRPDGTPYHPEGFGCGYLLSVDGTRVFYPGDSDVLDGHAELDVSVFLAPIGGSFAMGRDGAASLAAEIGPDLVVPVHYNTLESLAADSRAFAADVAASGIPVALDET